MKTFLKRVPWFYFLVGFYPLLFLWSYNKTQIDSIEVVRPLVVTIIGVGLLYAILHLIFRDGFKAALYGVLLLVLFFTYGQVYYWIRNSTGDVSASRHRILLVIYAALLALGSWLVLKWGSKLRGMQEILNIVSAVLVFIPVVQMGVYYISTNIAGHQLTSTSPATQLTGGKKSPDVYFILLDTYMRSDAMLADMGFDNSAFIDALKNSGFYIAGCSRPNYPNTDTSLITTLNMDYMPELTILHPNLGQQDLFGVYIKNNEVRQLLQKLGYITVAFRTTYAWTEMDNANVFLGLDRSPISLEYLHPFESMYLKSTAGLIISDIFTKLNLPQYFQKANHQQNSPYLAGSDFPEKTHVNSQLFILDQLPNVISISGPKFVFVHILIPHIPYVFAPDGKLLTDPGFYSGNLTGPIDANYERTGYIDSVQFINNRIIPILKKIISDSPVPPIIVLEGDHGLKDNNRFTNLLAYFLPAGYNSFYPTITPVNSFRLIFDQYFGADYSLLADVSYNFKGEVVPETYPGCKP